jgi:hypothetical protein
MKDGVRYRKMIPTFKWTGGGTWEIEAEMGHESNRCSLLPDPLFSAYLCISSPLNLSAVQAGSDCGYGM